MEVTLSVFGTFVRFVDMGSTWVNLLCYPFVAYLVGGPESPGKRTAALFFSSSQPCNAKISAETA